MARRQISKVGGFVHDINTVASLSDEQSNIRLLSDRSLYILQNLSLEDITFLSRYGEILTDGFYLPVQAGTPEQSDVQDAIDLIRRDLNSMLVEQLLECICAATNALVEQAVLAGQEVEDVSSDGEVAVGPDEQFETQSDYFDAKCNVANGMYDTILGAVTWLKDNNIDLLLGLFGGLTTGLIAGLIGAGPFGWAIVLVATTIAGLAGFISRYAISFSDLEAAMIDTHSECVLGLYNASDAAAAETSFISAVEAGTPPITSVEAGILALLITSDMANQLFSPRSDLVGYESPAPIDCGTALLQLWSFVASGEGWSFRDDSTGTYSASGLWSSAREAWEITIVGLGTGPGPEARGTVLITGLSIAVPAGGSIQMDHSASGDGVNTGRRIKAIFSDLTEQIKDGSPSSSAGTVVMTVPAAKTLAEIEISIRRNWSTAFNTTMDVEEVRVFGV